MKNMKSNSSAYDNALKLYGKALSDYQRARILKVPATEMQAAKERLDTATTTYEDALLEELL